MFDVRVFCVQGGVLHLEARGGDWFAYLTGGVGHLCGELREEGYGVFRGYTSQGLVALCG